jgi:hypothetical protein
MNYPGVGSVRRFSIFSLQFSNFIPAALRCRCGER